MNQGLNRVSVIDHDDDDDADDDVMIAIVMLLHSSSGRTSLRVESMIVDVSDPDQDDIEMPEIASLIIDDAEPRAAAVDQ